MVRRENRHGRGITFTYDESGRLKKAETDNKTRLNYDYNETGQLTFVTDHTERRVELSYEKGKLVRVINPAGSIYIYRYGKNGRIEETVNSRGYTAVKNAYDEKRRVICQEFPDGGCMRYDYNDSKKQVILTERNGSRTTYVHDSKYRNTDILYEGGTKEHFAFNRKNQRILHVDRNGNAIRRAYDDRGNLTQIIDALGKKTNLTYNAQNQLLLMRVNGREKFRNCYDKNGNLISSASADGSMRRFAYDGYGRLVYIENADKSTTKITYDERGNIEKICDAEGIETCYQYDSLNRMYCTTDGNGNTTLFEYDEAGRIKKIINPLGDSRSYSYNESGKVTEIIDFDGSRIRRGYNALNKLETITDQEGRVTRFKYDRMWNPAKIVRPNGAVTEYSYDNDNRLVMIKDALGNKTHFTYDGNGNRLSMEDAAGAKTRFSYDAAGHIIQVTNPEGAVADYEYDEEGRLIRSTDALGNKTVRIYDIMGRLQEVKNSAGKIRRYKYTALGNIDSVTEETGLEIHFTYLPGERKIRGIEYPDGTREVYTYDANGNLVSKTDRIGYTRSYSYDCLNRLTEISGEAGERIIYTYDAVGNVISRADAHGNMTRYEYSLTGKLVRVTDALGNEAEYTYDENNMLTGILQKGVSDEGIPRKTEYQRDILGRIEKVTDALGRTEHYKYDQRGEVIEKVDKEGFLTKYGYTMCGDLEYLLYADGREVKFTYNPLRRLEEVKDWIGITKITSDAAGRAVEVLYPDGKKVSYTYGEAGKRTSLIYPDGKTVHYGYNALCRLAEVREGDATICYQYDDLGRLSEKSFSNGIKSSYEYDERGLLASLVHRDREGILDAYSYRYDLMANKTGIIKERRGLPEESGSYTYGYDALGRLESVAKDGEVLRKYGYDAYGNRTSLIEGGNVKNYSYNALNQLICETDMTPEGKMEEQFSYDMRGNLIQVLLNGKIKNQYAYGALNRLEWAKNAAGEEAEYIYNGLGHRVGRTEKRLEGQETYREEKVEYVIDLTKQYQNLLQKEEGENRQDFLWGGNVVGIIDEDYSYRFFVEDELGSPVRLMGDSGEPQENYGYDEFGRDLYHNRKRTQPFGYTGYQPDGISGNYFAQAREYMPSVGRFASRDEDKFISIMNMHSMNLYHYCMSNPVRHIDPSGCDLEDIYPLTTNNENNAVQINVSGNDIMIDVYVDFEGDEKLTTGNGTPCKDLVVAGIENWSGNYLDVFGENVTVDVNVHEGDSREGNLQNYVTIYLEANNDTPYTTYNGWSKSSSKKIHMYRWDDRNEDPYTDETYVRTISHETGHVFGIGDGYPDTRPLNELEKEQSVIRRPDASELGLLDRDDIMVSQFGRLNISNTDIAMLILAYWGDEHQSFTNYTGHKQSEYFQREGKR